jgi:hypothetical protein
VSTHLLFCLQLVHNRGQFRQDLVRLLVVFELGGDEVGEVAEGLGGIEDLLKYKQSGPFMFSDVD